MRFKKRNIVIAVLAYLWVLAVAFGMHPVLGLFGAIYAGAMIYVAHVLLRGAEARRSTATIEFVTSGATEKFGIQYASFHHVYESEHKVSDALRTAIGSGLGGKLGCPDLRAVAFEDLDPDVQKHESRNFWLTHAPESSRMSGFTFLCTFANVGRVQSVRWWILVSGQRDPNKVFWRYAFAPVTAPLSILPYMSRRYDPLLGLTTIQEGFFNSIDVLNRTREIQFVAFETLVEVLESFGIDTGDLKQQKGNILNVNVSGGKASFGAVVQGAMNKVRGTAQGAQA